MTNIDNWSKRVNSIFIALAVRTFSDWRFVGHVTPSLALLALLDWRVAGGSMVVVMIGWLAGGWRLVGSTDGATR